MRSRRGLAAMLVLAIALVVVIVVTVNLPLGNPNTVGSPLLDKPAPDFTLTTLDGRSVSLFDYQGRPVIVNFWASWCIPCRDEFPLFAAARSQHAADGLEVLGIVHQDSAAAAADFAASQGATWPLLMDPDDTAWKDYQGFGVPSTYFIDRAGVVRATSLGPVTATSLPIQLATIL